MLNLMHIFILILILFNYSINDLKNYLKVFKIDLFFKKIINFNLKIFIKFLLTFKND